MQKLTKAEFMQKVINDKYAKRYAENECLNCADKHAISNVMKTKDYKGRKRK